MVMVRDTFVTLLNSLLAACRSRNDAPNPVNRVERLPALLAGPSGLDAITAAHAQWLASSRQLHGNVEVGAP
jgi:hypothetical protein